MSQKHQDTDHKERFQLERIALFSDAVFAIAITLLIIEIKVPELRGVEINDENLVNGLLHSIPKFIGFFISFFVIGLYWMAHHRLFRYVVRSNQKLLSNNLLFLLPIVMMPFSTVFLSEHYFAQLHVPLIVYTVNICFAGICSYRLWKIAGTPKYELSQGLDKPILNYNTTRALTTPIVFILITVVSFINQRMAYFVLPIMPFISTLIKQRFKKKYPQLWQQHHL